MGHDSYKVTVGSVLNSLANFESCRFVDQILQKGLFLGMYNAAYLFNRM